MAAALAAQAANLTLALGALFLPALALGVALFLIWRSAAR